MFDLCIYKVYHCAKQDKVENMRGTVTLDHDKLEELLKETKVKTKAKAVGIAIDEYLRRKKIERIKSLKGKLTFDLTADEIRHRER